MKGGLVVSAAVRSEGSCWLGTTHWKGQVVLWLSICNWITTEDDIASVLRVLKNTLADVEASVG